MITLCYHAAAIGTAPAPSTVTGKDSAVSVSRASCATLAHAVHHACEKESCIVGDQVTRVVLGCTWCGPSRRSRACRPTTAAGGAGGIGGLRPLDVDIATNTTHNGQLLSIAAVKGRPPSPPNRVVGLPPPRTYGYGRLVRGTWIIVFLEGGWWSALLAFERMVIVERVQSRVRRI